VVTKPKASTRDPLLSAAEVELAECKGQLSVERSEHVQELVKLRKDLDTCRADWRVVGARNEALQAALVMAHEALRRSERERRQDGDKLALAG